MCRKPWRQMAEVHVMLCRAALVGRRRDVPDGLKASTSSVLFISPLPPLSSTTSLPHTQWPPGDGHRGLLVEDDPLMCHWLNRQPPS